MQITKEKITAFYTLLRTNGLADDKAAICLQLSNGRTGRVSQLTYQEAQQWINAMNQQGRNYQAQEDKKKCQPMINKLIATAHEMGWIKQAAEVQPDGTVKLKKDYTDLHKWVNKYGYLKKPLNDYTYTELPTLVSAFDNVYKAWLKR